jgi:molybdopterin synthase sulfur carrier subunit
MASVATTDISTTDLPTTTSIQSSTQPRSTTSATTAESHSEAKGTFTLLLFANASSFASDTESLTLPAPTTLSRVLAELERRWPGIGAKVLSGSAFCVNLEYVDFEYAKNGAGEAEGGEVEIQVGDEVAVVPPVSSG